MISKKAAKKAAKAIAAIGLVPALKALFRYRAFLSKGGKRPFVHDETGRIIAPVCPQLVDALIAVARLGLKEEIIFDDLFQVMPKRQCLRLMRRARHEFRRAARLVASPLPEPTMENTRANIVPPAETLAKVHSINEAVEVIFKPGGSKGRQYTVVAFFDGRGSFNSEGKGIDPVGWDKSKFRTVYYIEADGQVIRATAKSGGAKSMAISVMEASGWKWERLGDEKFVGILNHYEQYGRDGEVPTQQEVAA